MGLPRGDQGQCDCPRAQTELRPADQGFFEHADPDFRGGGGFSGRADSGGKFVQQLAKKMGELGVGKIGTLVGRYYAMDRDNRWERIELAYRALAHGEAETRSADPVAALNASYEAGVSDEFIKPIVV